MAHWRSRPVAAPSGLVLALWWTFGAALTVPSLLLALKLLRWI